MSDRALNPSTTDATSGWCQDSLLRRPPCAGRHDVLSKEVLSRFLHEAVQDDLLTLFFSVSGGRMVRV